MSGHDRISMFSTVEGAVVGDTVGEEDVGAVGATVGAIDGVNVRDCEGALVGSSRALTMSNVLLDHPLGRPLLSYT